MTTAGGLSAFGLQHWVPVVLGFGAMLTSFNEHGQYEQRLATANSLVVQLNQLTLWWRGLSAFQQGMPDAKESLVRSAELAILAEAGAGASLMLSADRKDHEEEAAEEEEEES